MKDGFLYFCFTALHKFKLQIKILFQKLFGSKFKKSIWLSLSIMAILSAVFIRTVPNYSKKYGFEIVSL